jgi:outer membrane protein TolC
MPLASPLSLAPEGPLPTIDAGLDALIADAMNSNPDKQRLELAMQAAEHKIDEAKSGYLPTIGLEASTYQVWNTYKDGLFNDANRNGWTVGLGLKWDLLDSGLTRAGVDSARAAKMKLEAQRMLLDSGLALQVKDDFLRIRRSRAQVDDSARAQAFAEENRQLHVRAYQEELVETKDVIEAQIIESFARASLYRARNELRTAVADLDFLLGRALEQSRP